MRKEFEKEPERETLQINLRNEGEAFGSKILKKFGERGRVRKRKREKEREGGEKERAKETGRKKRKKKSK